MGYENLRWVDLPKGIFFTIEGSSIPQVVVKDTLFIYDGEVFIPNTLKSTALFNWTDELTHDSAELAMRWNDSPIAVILGLMANQFTDGDYYNVELYETSPEMFLDEDIENTTRYETGSGKQLFDVLEDDLLTPEEFRGFLKGNIYKYNHRYLQKNGIKDLEKAKVYQDRLINFEQKQ